MFAVRPVENKKTWEEFVLAIKPNTFLQSWSWGAFHQNLGEKVIRLGFWDGQKLVGVALLIKEIARRGTYLACPAGPLLDWRKRSLFPLFVKQLYELGQAEGVAFVRVRPSLLESEKNSHLFKEAGFIPAPMHMHAETTWELDLSPSEEELLAGMKKNTRYSLRRAKREGVVIKQSQKLKNIDFLYDLQMETARRQHFIPFKKEFLKEQFRVFSQANQASLFLAYWQKKLLAVSMIIFYGDTAVYHYSGSTKRFPKIPASSLIQWAAIKEAKKRGCSIYNFWGIAPDNNPRHRFAGVTPFKKSFGGQRVDHLHAQDLPLGARYWLAYGVETIRRVSRRL